MLRIQNLKQDRSGGCLFAGRAEKFFRQIVHLFLKHHLMGSLFLNDRSEGTDQFCLLGHYRIQL